jgi:hypothetical protein
MPRTSQTGCPAEFAEFLKSTVCAALRDSRCHGAIF